MRDKLVPFLEGRELGIAEHIEGSRFGRARSPPPSFFCDDDGGTAPLVLQVPQARFHALTPYLENTRYGHKKVVRPRGRVG